MRVYGYVRVSTEEQAGSGQSLEVQEEKVELFCRLHGLDLVEIIQDAGVSAKSLDRPGIQRALRGLRDGDASGLIVVKLDRLSRSVRDWAHLVENYFGGRAKSELFSVSDSIDTRTAAGRMVLNIIMSVAEWEREAIGERTQAVLQHKVSKGEVVSRAPRGLKIRGKGLEPDPASNGLEIARVARGLREEGQTLRGIAGSLTALGYRPERGRAWHPSTISNIIKNPRLEPFVCM